MWNNRLKNSRPEQKICVKLMQNAFKNHFKNHQENHFILRLKIFMEPNGTSFESKNNNIIFAENY